jgi:polyisoprenoid-binding protein YceI
MRLLALFVTFVSSVSEAVPLDPAKGRIEFLAIGRPSAIKINGKGPGPSGEMGLVVRGEDVVLSGEARLDLNQLVTGISTRDEHMKNKYLETDKYPEAVLKINETKIAKDLMASGGKIVVPGTLTLHGQEKPVAVQLEIFAESNSYRGISTFKVKLSDFAITIPSFAGVTVADEVEVKVETSLKKEMGISAL